jgi:hypothetical protein
MYVVKTNDVGSEQFLFADRKFWSHKTKKHRQIPAEKALPSIFFQSAP